MLTKLQKLIARRRRRRSRDRRLAVEALESRTVLSATKMAVLASIADSAPSDLKLGLIDKAPFAKEVQNEHSLLQINASRGSELPEFPDTVSLSARLVRSSQPKIAHRIDRLSPTDDVRDGTVNVDNTLQEQDPRSFAQPTWEGSIAASWLTSIEQLLPISRENLVPDFALAPPPQFVAAYSSVFQSPTRGQLAERHSGSTAPNLAGQTSERLATVFGINASTIRARHDTEGGIIPLRPDHSWTSPTAPVPHLATLEKLVTKGPASRLRELYDIENPPSFHRVPFSAELHQTSVVSALDSLATSTGVLSSYEGGVVNLIVDGTSGVTDLYATASSRAAEDLVTVGETALASNTRSWQTMPDGEPSPDPYGSNAMADHLSPLSRVRLPALDDEPEGGLINIATTNEKSTLSTNRPTSDNNSAIETSRDADDWRSLDSIWSSLGRGNELVEKSTSASELDEQAPEEDEQDGETAEAERAERNSCWAAYSEEGGMIELVAASSSQGHDSWRSPPSEQAQPALSPEAGDIPMDVGVGLFQAFELATAPREPVDDSDAVSSDNDLPTESTASTATDEHPPVEQSAAVSKDGSADQSDQRAAAVPAVIVVTYLIDRWRRKKEPVADHFCDMHREPSQSNA